MIKVVGEKEVDLTGEIIKGIRLKKLRGMKLVDLPYEYKTKQPHCYFGTDSVFVRTKGLDKNYYVGDFVSQEEWHRLIDALFQCGERLKGINEKIKKEVEGWSGTIEVDI